jgi:HAD superfamily hydrolase (TIGR01509 family)
VSAILFGSISTLADTSELQRRAFNDAFATHGLDWTWDRESYRRALDANGGADRIAAYADERGEDVDAAAVHATKTTRFQELLGQDPVPARPGVTETIEAARERGIAVGVVTTTSPGNVAAVLGAIGVDGDLLDLVLDAEQVERPKPDAAAYELALRRLDLRPESCIAVEDNPGGVTSATTAGVRCVAFPNANTRDLDVPGAAATVDRIDLDELLGHVEVAG